MHKERFKVFHKTESKMIFVLQCARQGGDSPAGTKAFPVEKIIKAKVCRKYNPMISRMLKEV